MDEFGCQQRNHILDLVEAWKGRMNNMWKYTIKSFYFLELGTE